MIRAYDTTTKQYNLFTDYVAKFGNDNDYGEARTITAIASHADGIQITAASHNLMAGQSIIIDGTTNHDGEKTVVTVVDSDNFTVSGTFVATDTGTVYPYMENSYYIAFLLGFEEIFNMIKRRSAYLGSRLGKENGDNMMDEVTITEDDEDLFTGFLRTGFHNVVNILQSRSKSIQNAYQFNQDVDLDADGTGSGTYYLLFIIKTDETDESRNAYYMIEEKIKEMLVGYTLMEWFKFVGQMQLMAMMEKEYLISRDSLRGALNNSQGHKRVRFYERPTF